MAPNGLASAPHPPANRGGAVGGAAAASPEPPGLRRPKRAILQRVGRSPEQHRQRFRSGAGGENGRPFVMAHQLRDACRRWLLAGEGGVDHHRPGGAGAFIARLPKKTAQWVQCHRPASLDLAIQLARTRWWRATGLAKPYRPFSLSPSPSVSPPISSQVPCRRGSSPARWRGGPAPESAGRAHAREAGSASPSSALFPFLRGLHANSLSHFPPLGWRGSLGRPVGVAGTRATSSIGVQ